MPYPSLYSDGRRVYRRSSPDIPAEGRRALGLDTDVVQPDTAGERPAPVEVPDYGAMKKAELQALADARGLAVEGTGSGGSVVKDDLVRALRQS